MRAEIVVGLGFGDEGKGITVDYLCTQSKLKPIVIRFSGGQQAGHTVFIDGKYHTYASFGSGTGRGVPTYISEYCTVYPPNLFNEYLVLVELGYHPELMIHPLAKLTTPWDVAWNRLTERINNHGSCGIGVGATMKRNEETPYKLYMVDIMHPALLGEKLKTIAAYYMEKVTDLKVFGLPIKSTEIESFVKEGNKEVARWTRSFLTIFIKSLVAEGIHSYDFLKNYNHFVFEGSQGIMLDMEHGVFPNVTYSSTTSKNAIAICKELQISQLGSIDLYYVTRCYQTRHGEGWMSPLTMSGSLINIESEKNIHNDWQKNFRCMEIDYNLLQYALKVDESYSWGYHKHLVVTCLDQREGFEFDYNALKTRFSSIHESWSPDSKDFKLKAPVILTSEPAMIPF